MPDLPDAHVLETGHRSFKVRPGVVAVKHDDGFDVRNLTAWPAWFQFPDGIVEPDAARKAGEATLQKLFPEKVAALLATSHWVGQGARAHFTFSPGVEGAFDYTVVVLTAKGPVEAIGESAPKIIIEP